MNDDPARIRSVSSTIVTNADSDRPPAKPGGPIEVVERFICDLQRRAAAAGICESADSLVLAEAALRLGRGTPGLNERPLQVALIGPTQVGKSTVFNLLLGREVSPVSPLAGFTVHPSACIVGSPAPPRPTSGSAAPPRATSATGGRRSEGAPSGELEWTRDIFPGWCQAAPGELNREELAAYSLTALDGAMPEYMAIGPQAPGPAVVFWDTPDFDSLAAAEYRQGVLETAALADVYLLVLSKEKYSDLSVWNMLKLLAPLGRPLIICLNKLTPESAEAVQRSLRERLAEYGQGWGDVPVFPLEYRAELATVADPNAVAESRELIAPLAAELGRRMAGLRGRSLVGVRALVEQQWQTWTAPIRAEHAALAEWDHLVQAGLQQFLERYQQDYLDHPQRYDSFRRAALELLHLLEIPKVSKWIAAARQTVTWPIRQVWGAGRELLRSGDRPQHELGPETTVLIDSLDNMLMWLERELTRRSLRDAPGAAVWRAVAQRLQNDEQRLRGVFEKALLSHHEEVRREVQAAASQLYEELRKHPARLAALRTGRAAIDAAALALAVKTGGLTPVDAVFAPASFAVSSLLMEGIAGLQMGSVARNLKKRQLEAVQSQLVQGVLGAELYGLAVNLQMPGLLGIPPQRLEEASRALRTWGQEGQP
jgi:hypothetical protein